MFCSDETVRLPKSVVLPVEAIVIYWITFEGPPPVKTPLVVLLPEPSLLAGVTISPKSTALPVDAIET